MSFNWQREQKLQREKDTAIILEGKTTTTKKARCTYDWNGLPDEAETSFDACIFAAAAGRPQPHHVLRAEEQHQHDLLQGHRAQHERLRACEGHQGLWNEDVSSVRAWGGKWGIISWKKKKKKKKRKKSRDQTGPGHVAKDSLPYKRVMTGWACEVVGQEPRSPTWKNGGWLGHRWQLTLGAGQRSSEWRCRRRPPKPIGRPNNQCGCHR